MFIYALTGKILGAVPLDIESETPLLVPSEYHEPVEAYVNFLRTNHDKRIDVIGRFSTLLSQKKEMIPLGLPPDTKWEHLTIEFLNEQDVKIAAPGFSKKTDYKEMAFIDNRTKTNLPNKQWEWLKELAENHGEFSWSNRKASPLIKQRKKLLSDALKACFQIDEDPFYPYKPIGAYKIKINLIPD